MGNTKRRDTKGRVLRPGESQQKDGRYRYTYYINGKQHCFYSWKLEDTDRIPQGKHLCTSLRSQIKWLNKSREQGIAFRGNGISILGLAERYLEIQNANNKIRTSTKAGYRTALKHIREDPVSSVRIDKFKKSDAKKWIMSLKGKGFGYSTISSIHGVVKPAFQMAVDDDLILKNPFDFVLTDLIENDSTKRDSLTLEEQDSLLEFIKNDRYYSQYYDAIVILFETGLRIAEFCGLTSDKIDMENRMITIDTQLHRDKQGYYLEKPKTSAGFQTVPITDKAYEGFSNLLQSRTVFIIVTALFLPDVERWWGILCGCPFLLAALTVGGIGGADIKIMGAAGMVLGLRQGISAMIIGLLGMLAYHLGRKILSDSKEKVEQSYPLIPFLTAGMMLAYLTLIP